mgnify:FL=1
MKQIKPGARVRVYEKISAEGKSAKAGKGKKGGGKDAPAGRIGRTSKFEGIVLSRKHGSESGASFRVRAIILGVGVEKSYPLHAPTIEKVQILSSPRKVHRAKLYYMRNLSRTETRQHIGAMTEGEQKG